MLMSWMIPSDINDLDSGNRMIDGLRQMIFFNNTAKICSEYKKAFHKYRLIITNQLEDDEFIKQFF